MDIDTVARTSSPIKNGDTIASNPTSIDIASQIKTPHNTKLYQENQKLKEKVNELMEYQIANPKIMDPTSRADIDYEREVEAQIAIKKKHIRAQLAVIKTLYRQSVMKVREEKALTTESRNVNDALILQLHNLKYEEQSLASEISATENYDHKYKKLSLVDEDEFQDLFPEHKDSTAHELMTARIEHEYQVRVKLEERRQEKLKQKQMLISEVKKRKDDLTKLDGMLENFIEAADPIQKALATEKFDALPPAPPKKVPLGEKLRGELQAVENEVTNSQGAMNVQEVSKKLVDRFGPIMQQAIHHYATKDGPNVQGSNQLAARFSQDLQEYLNPSDLS